MTELFHQWGGDLALTAGGDLALASGTTEGRQRVLRRILTNPGNYVFDPPYGGGAQALVGSLATPQAVEAAMRSQMLQEQAVAQAPTPAVAVTPIPNGLNISIKYSDAQTGDPALLTFSIT